MIEITRGQSTYQYRIDPKHPHAIQVRVNEHNARWQRWGSRDSAQEATAALLEIEADLSAQDVARARVRE